MASYPHLSGRKELQIKHMYSHEAELVNQSHRDLTDGKYMDILTKARLLCYSRGVTGIMGLGRAFRHMDGNGRKRLNKQEFVKGMHHFGMPLSDDELHELFHQADKDGSGSIDVTEFLHELRPPIHAGRADIIDQVFDKIDKDHDGIITVDDLKKVYTVVEHPKYLTGEMSRDEILGVYAKHFEGGDGNTLQIKHMYSHEAELVNQSHRDLTDGKYMDILTKARLLCYSRGVTGIMGLGRAFRHMDGNGRKRLNKQEFVKGMHHFGMPLSDDELHELFHQADKDGSGSIDVTEFLHELRPPIHAGRADIIDQVFDKIDKDHDGIITVDDLKKVYTVVEHPKYLTGEMSRDEILGVYAKHFEGGDGNTITKEDFVNYYSSISACVDDNLFFDLMMRRAFAI